jgi:rRNA small subunit pseudouridine methyltransferase Nep1
MLNFVLAESALELVPKEIRGAPAVASDSRRRGIDASGILLDRSFHHTAMLKLRDSERRGRPDIVHTTLLTVVGTPLYLEGKVKALVHTYDGNVLEIEPKTRIPKNYIRFRGLMEEALRERPTGGLVRVHRMDVGELVRWLRSDAVIGLSVQGKMATFEELAEEISRAREPCVVMGGFPRGHFTPKTISALDELVRIHPKPLEAHVVASRMIYEVERSRERLND